MPDCSNEGEAVIEYPTKTLRGAPPTRKGHSHLFTKRPVTFLVSPKTEVMPSRSLRPGWMSQLYRTVVDESFA